MAYTPPSPGATEVGKPTPAGVPKQDAHIRDLPPEVRRSFLLSMVFFPSAVGGAICLVLFLGWWTLREPKRASQYAHELRHGILAGDNKRTRWQTAREIAENIGDPKIHDPEVLSALLEIVAKPDLDEEVDAWTPSDMIREAGERRTRLRWWAAFLAGHIAGTLHDPNGQGLSVLSAALEEESPSDPASAAGLRLYASAGLTLLKSLSAVDVLARRLAHDPDAGVRQSCAKALGTIGAQHFMSGAAGHAPADRLLLIQDALRTAYRKDSDVYVTWNAAIALARLKDDTGRATLEKLLQDSDPIVQRQAQRALEILDGK